jgi:hypothetical protein
VNSIERYSGISSSDDVFFPTKSGVQTYRVTNPDLNNGAVRFLFGPNTNAANAFAESGSTILSMAGMSPFTTFFVNFDGMGALPGRPLDVATELMAVFELDSKPGAVTGVATCR